MHYVIGDIYNETSRIQRKKKQNIILLMLWIGASSLEI